MCVNGMRTERSKKVVMMTVIYDCLLGTVFKEKQM